MKGDILTWARLKADKWEELRADAREATASGRDIEAAECYRMADVIRADLGKEGFSVKQRYGQIILKDPAGVVRMHG